MINIEVFTDGSCMKGRKVIGGYGIHFPNKEHRDLSRPFLHPPVTNQRAELYAIYAAIAIIKKKIKIYDKITIFTDSEYSIKSLTIWMYQWMKNNWQTAGNQDVKNQDILKPLYSIISKQKSKIIFHHVRSHTGKQDRLSIGNSIADKLATDGARRTNDDK